MDKATATFLKISAVYPLSAERSLEVRKAKAALTVNKPYVPVLVAGGGLGAMLGATQITPSMRGKHILALMAAGAGVGTTFAGALKFRANAKAKKVLDPENTLPQLAELHYKRNKIVKTLSDSGVVTG